jgi:heat-inducible transcriptional repressor
MSQLQPRQEVILRAIVLEYVGGAEPVASELITSKYELGVKSATIRNEMADMSEMGYLEQPHTSAGRVPSDRGYRYFVDYLMKPLEPVSDAKSRVSDAASQGEALQGLLRETTRALSRATHLLSAATTIRDGAITVRSPLVSAIGPHQALLVLPLSNGDVKNRGIECPPGLTLEEIGAANEALREHVTGKTLRQIQRAKPPAGGRSPAHDKFLGIVWASLRSIARELTRGHLISEGEEFLFGQPEFQRELPLLSDLIDKLKESDILFDALAAPGENATTVTIGRENRHSDLQRLSVIRQSFYVGQNEVGTIAIVGPTRMPYEAGIPLVNFTAKALSEALTRHFG